MAITANTYNVESVPSAVKHWMVSLYSVDLTGAEAIKAAEAGYKHYLTKLTIRTATGMAITIGSGETTGAVTTTHIGPVPLDGTSGILAWRPAIEKYGLRCTDDLALVIDSDTAGAVWIDAAGYTAKINNQ